MTDFSAESVPTLDPTNIKGSIREFERWYMESRDFWPAPLDAAGQRALLTLKSLDQRNLSPAFLEASKADLQAFATAYAEWKR